MAVKRTDRLNSLLKEVITEVIRSKVRNPNVHSLTSVSRVEITRDLKKAKVFISTICSDQESIKTLRALNSAAGFIGLNSAKEVVMRCFPTLTFKLDDTVEKQMLIDDMLSKINKDKEKKEKKKTESFLNDEQ